MTRDQTIQIGVHIVLSKTIEGKLIPTAIAALALVALTAALAVTPAFAATTAATGDTLTSGTLTGGDIGFADFAATTLTGTQQTTTADWSIGNVVDARGTGAGWGVSLSLTQLKEYDTGTSAYVASGKTLDTSSIKVTTAPVVTLADATSSAASTVTPVAAATAVDTGSAVTVLDAAAAGGMGSYSVSPMTVTLTVPASAYAKTYKTDATVSLLTATV